MLESQCLLLNALNGQLCGFDLLFSQTVLHYLGASADQEPFPAVSLHVAIPFWKLGKFRDVDVMFYDSVTAGPPAG